MESPLRRSSTIDNFPQPPSKSSSHSTSNLASEQPAAANQTFLRHLSTSSASSSALNSPTFQYTGHSTDHPFFSSTGHSNFSSSDSRSRSTTSSRSSVYSEYNDLDLKAKSPLTVSTNFMNFAESPIDPFFKNFNQQSAPPPPQSPILEELSRSHFSARSTSRGSSVDQFGASLHASGPASPHPLQQNLSSRDIDTSPTSETTVAPLPVLAGSPAAADAIKFHAPGSDFSRPLPLTPANIEKQLPPPPPIEYNTEFREREADKMPHVITQPANTAMLNRSNSASSDSSFNGRATVKAKQTGFGGFFGWGASNIQDLSPTHEKEMSLAEQRMSKIPSNIDVSLANAQASHPKRTDSGISLPPRTPMTIEETLEEELRVISADLAASIRRELELEDLVDTLQSQADSQGGLAAGRRTSDYFSDAGTGSSSYDSDLPSKDQLDYERVVRKSEQAQAQIRLEMTQKISDERQRRKGVELQVRELEEKVNQADLAVLRPSSPGRVRDLEIALEDARRKLSEERNLKANFEDLVTAIRDELEGYRNERDNLRDEVVPQLRARVEGLEMELVDSLRKPYEQSKMQQEIDALRTKNASLMETHRQILEMRQQGELILHTQAGPSSAATPVSGNFKDKESLLERIKDIEAQRDALQQSVRNLRMRNEKDSKKFYERIRTLEVERDRALRPTFRKMRKDKETLTFKTQLDRLRFRSDAAVDSKYTCERNLASLKLDLDRSEQELEDLRGLLQEQDEIAQEMKDLQETAKQLASDNAEQLFSDLRSRVVSNAMLRKRLVDAIEQGDQDRLMANTKINALSEMLKSVEEKIGDAQQNLEEAAQEREQESKDMKDTNPNYLRRIDENAATSFRPKVSPLAAREPKITPITGKLKDTRLHVLQHRVEQLEKTIVNADIEMEDIESRLNVTLLEMSDLRTETEQSSHHLESLRSQLAALQS